MKYSLLVTLLLIPVFSRADLYVVQKGDTLWGLASKYKLSASLIKKVNQLPYDELMAGQKLFLPKNIITHSVRSGETIESIAENYNISASYVITLNNLEDDMLAEGQKIKVPQTFDTENAKQTSTATRSAKTHTVTRGETLSGIALRYKVSLSSLKEWNDKNNSDIRIGETLLVQAPGVKTTPLKTREIQNPSAPRMITNTKTYTVTRGDTLGGIALRYKVPQKNLMEWNNKTRTTVYRGEKLKIFTIARASEPVENMGKPKKSLIHTVRKGENLRIIADKYDISLSDIRSWNNKKNDTIYPDERLKIYSETLPSKTRTLAYTVRKGDTLDGIAFKYDTSRSTLMAINKKKGTGLYAGEKLRVPAPEKSTVNSSSGQQIAKTQPELPQGVKSTRFSGIPLPIAQSELKTVSPSGRGVDIYLKTQASLRAPASAVVEYAGYINALQNVVILKIEDNRTLIYAGLGSISVQNGQRVDKGDMLGIAGYNTIEESPKIYMELRDKEQIANAFYAYKDLAKYAKK